VSHVTEMTIPDGDYSRVDDLEAIQQAALLMGGEFVEGAKSYNWYGRFMNDSKPPEWLKPEMMGKCDHKIRFPGIHYEVGVMRIGDEWKFVYDYYSHDLKTKLGGSGAPKLAEAYGAAKKQIDAVRAVMKTASSLGKKVKKVVMPGNVIKLEVQY